jgi:RHS repeat-associated protein
MDGISSQAAGRVENKKKYQKYEVNNDFDLNTYEAFYRTHDPQIGRWWQIDPKPTVSESPYVVMGDNPISGIDVLGDLVGYQKEEGVSKKEFRQFKRHIRLLRRNSETFNKMFKEFKNNKNATYNFIARNGSEGGGSKKNSSGGYDIGVGIHGDYSKALGGKRGLFETQLSMIAHETAHAWRKTHNLDPADLVCRTFPHRLRYWSK